MSEFSRITGSSTKSFMMSAQLGDIVNHDKYLETFIHLLLTTVAECWRLEIINLVKFHLD